MLFAVAVPFSLHAVQFSLLVFGVLFGLTIGVAARYCAVQLAVAELASFQDHPRFDRIPLPSSVRDAELIGLHTDSFSIREHFPFAIDQAVGESSCFDDLSLLIKIFPSIVPFAVLISSAAVNFTIAVELDKIAMLELRSVAQDLRGVLSHDVARVILLSDRLQCRRLVDRRSRRRFLLAF